MYEEVLHGSVAWLTNGRCFRLQEQSQDEAALDQGLQDLKSMVSEVSSRLGALESSQNELKAQLTVVDDSLHTYREDDAVAE